ncbi:MAG: sulfatase-like hydrolase/transferase [Kiritimatiellales bacterium]|nr:sulfatase-like hydrolase/transferase [Kiritimatiellales bacterium]
MNLWRSVFVAFGLLIAFPASAERIVFKLNGNGDPTHGGTDSSWKTMPSGSYEKTKDPRVAVYGVDLDFDSADDVTIELRSPTAKAGKLLLNGGGKGGISLDGNEKGGLNKDEVLRIRFDTDVTIAGFSLNAFSDESADYCANGNIWTTTSPSVSGLSIDLPSGQDFEIKLTNPSGSDQFRFGSIDIILPGKTRRSYAPKGPIVRLRPLQNRGTSGIDGDYWQYDDYTAQDVLRMIKIMKPTVLERYISGPLDPDARVPVARGEPPMTVAEFLNASMKAGAPGCTISPRISLEVLPGKPCKWNKKFSDCFYAVADNLYNLPIDPPIRTLSLDNWGGYSKTHSDGEIKAMLDKLVDMGWGRIAANYIGGNHKSYGIIKVGMFGVDHDTYLPKMNAHAAIALNQSIEDIMLYIDFRNPAEEFSQLPPDEQAAKLYEIAALQKKHDFTFVWPVIGADFWDVTKVFTSKTGPYGGKSIFDVMVDAMHNGSQASTRVAKGDLPNIVLFLADDMGQGDTSAYQDFTGIAATSQVYTPSMEKLAKSGMRFTDGHAAAAVCHPSRMSLMRGGRPEKNPADFGVHALPKMLKRAGYNTYGIGKWHVWYRGGGSDKFDVEGRNYHSQVPAAYGPLDFGFDHYTGTEDNITHSPAFIVDRQYMKYHASTKTLRPNMSKTPPGYGNPEGPIENICQQLWINAAREYMAAHAPGGSQANRPFFLYYASHANHKQYFPATDIDGIDVKGSCRVASGRILSEKNFDVVKHSSLGGGSTYLENGLILERSEMVWENDVALSLIMDWLNKTDDPRHPGHKMVDNTLLVFAADNGANIDRQEGDIIPHPNHGKLRGRKGNIWEGGHRVPFIMSWPGRIPPNTTSAAQISLMDMYATFAEIAGEPLRTDEALCSFSALDAMLDPAVKNYRSQGIYAADKVKRDENSLRDGGYKIIWHGSRKPTFVELYNLDSDLGETRNLLGNPEYAEIEARLTRRARAMIPSGRLRPN